MGTGRWAICLTTLLVAFLAPVVLRAQEQKHRKVALLVGVKQYPKGVLSNLAFTESDMDALGQWLETKGGFEIVTVMTQAHAVKDVDLLPTRRNIEKNLDELLKLMRPRRGDQIFVALSGHGVELRDETSNQNEAFFCPADVEKEEKRLQNMVSLKSIYDKLYKSAADVKVLVVDACREVKGNKGDSDDLDPPNPPKGIAAFFSCRSGQKSFEYDQDKPDQPRHGLFIYRFLEGLNGAGADNGGITLDTISKHVKDTVPLDAKRIISVKANQDPHIVLNTEGTSIALAKISAVSEPMPGEVREFEIASGVKMKFCWIPPGESQLGSPKSERQAVLKNIKEDKEPEWLASEAEEVRGKYTTKGFWLGKYPVTQNEWQAVMRNNPSYHAKEGGNKEKVAGMDTSRFPVEMVSWEDCAKFVEKLNDRGSLEKVFGKRGKFVLPQEDEWEYACRGGRGNKQAFYFGDALNGSQANCNGEFPYGAETKGPNKHRTTEVGSYESEAPHPWGLCDMHGNVYQWCENYVSEQKCHVARGGPWNLGAWSSRAANRYLRGAGILSDEFGFRVSFRLD